MRRFFFDIDRGQTVHDEDGELLADLDAARRVAVLVLAEILQAHGALSEATPIVIRIRDDKEVVHALQARVVPT